jgi:hypothetical protein
MNSGNFNGIETSDLKDVVVGYPPIYPFNLLEDEAISL